MNELDKITVKITVETNYGLSNEQCSKIEEFLLNIWNVSYVNFELTRNGCNAVSEDGLGEAKAVWKLSEQEVEK